MCVYKDWLPNKRSGSKPVLQWQSVLPHTCLPTVCLFVAEDTSVQSSGVPASARRRRFRKVPIHGSRGQDGSNLLPRKGIVGVRFSCHTFSARLLSDVSRETAPGTLSLTGELFDLRHAISGRVAVFRKKAGFAPPMTKSHEDFKIHASETGLDTSCQTGKKFFSIYQKPLQSK